MLQATDIIREADKYSDKYGLATVMAIGFAILVLLAVWRYFVPMLREAQSDYKTALKDQIAQHEAITKAQMEREREITKEFLSAIKGVEESHKEVVAAIKRERTRGDRQ